MKFRLLTFVFVVQYNMLVRTQTMTTTSDSVYTLKPLTSTPSTAKPPTTTFSTAEPPTPTFDTAEPTTSTSSTAEPPTPTSSTAEHPTTTASTAEPLNPTSSTAEPPIPTSSTAEPTTSTSGTAEPPIPTSSTAEPTTPTSSTAEPPIPTSSTAEPLNPTSSTAEPPIPTSSTAEPTTPTSSTAEPTTPTSSTAEPPKHISCPEKQSGFYKDDLKQLIDYKENEMNVVANLNHSFYTNVTHIANDLMLKLNAYIIELEDEPNHVLATLDDIKMQQGKNILPLVKTANTTLNELLSIENEKVAKLFAKMTLMLREKYKAEQFCKYACDFSSNALSVKNYKGIINKDNYLCSTLPDVLDKVKRWFSSFMEEQSKHVAVYINNYKDKIYTSIGKLKETLSETSINILGASMANVLHLKHDVIKAVESIEEFNAQSYKYRFGQINANLSMLFMEFKKNIMLYRKECVKCDSMSLQMDVPRKEEEPNILDQLLDEKATELENECHAIISSIFSELYKKVNDEKFIEKTINRLKPLAKDLAAKATQERKDFDDVMQSAPKEERERLAVLYNKTESMVSNIINENEKLQDMIRVHHLS